MKSMVIYDSAFGNTEKVAVEIAKHLNTSATLISDLKDQSLARVDLLVIGTPTQGGLATKPIQEFIRTLSGKKTLKVAVFDTRFAPEDHGLALKALMKTIGFASPKMAKQVSERGIELAGEPEGFIVGDKEGPLRDGELERATKWAKALGK